MSAVLDSITGGGLLPHVRCHNIIVGDDKVTLNLELWQEQDVLYNSSWLNDLNVGNQNLLDSIFIQVVPFRNLNNVLRLLPNQFATEDPGNIYTAKYHLGDNYLPRGEYGGISSTTGGLFDNESSSDEENVRPAWPPAPIQVSNSSLLGDISAADAMPNYSQNGAVQERVEQIGGRQKKYFVVPFEYSEEIAPGLDNLSFAFYTFLNVPYWLQNLEIGVDISSNSSFFEEFIIEGPPNVEAIFINGALQTQRYTFLKENGQAWNGAVHLHTKDNPDPNGYRGDGSINSQEFTGWMVGESHNPQEEQEKLYLTLSPNNKIIDQASGTEVADGVFVL